MRLKWACSVAVMVALGCSGGTTPVVGPVDASGDGSRTDGTTSADSPGTDVVNPQGDTGTDVAMDTVTTDTGPADASVVADGAADVATDVAPDVSCPTGQTMCGASCTTTASDPSNCGACGTVCMLANATSGCGTGMCSIASCNAGYADCNTTAADGCEANTATSSTNCGACGNACTFANAMGACTGGSCGIGTCNTGYGNCNMMTSDGCETNLNTTVTSCGSCGSACSLANATPACTAGACTIAACSTGYGDCNTMAADGCEAPLNTNTNCGACGTSCMLGTHCSMGMCVSSCPTGTTFCSGTETCSTTQTDVTNCGTCGTACATPPNSSPTCATGACGFSCNTGFANCDMMAANGCEANLATNVSNCGSCGTACATANATPACSAGVCAIGVCNVGYADCDHSPTDGCEVNLNTTPTSCGACGSTCNVPNATAGCAAGVCTVGSCNAGFADCDGLATNGCERPVTTNTDCGTCGHACGAGTYCSAGACVSSCPAGSTYCPSTDVCANFTSDTNNCGMCGTVCLAVANAAPACSSGTCGYTCNTGFADCDGVASNGCEANIGTSVANCGSCGAACTLSNATPACASGTCAVASCASGYGNCDGNPANGCEANLNTSAITCGTCSNVCNLANAVSGCSSGACTVATCNAGYGDCDHVASNGCEAPLNSNTNCGACGTSCAAGSFCSGGTCVSSCGTGTTFCAASGTCVNTTSDPLNCGSCSHVCPTDPNSSPFCSSGTCSNACAAGYGDCDGVLSNGCETNLNTTTADCGACGTACSLANATAACVSGACAVASCATGYGNCDGNPANGCETNLNTTATACGTCDTVCNLPNAVAGCAAGACTVASCLAGFGDCDHVASNGCETALTSNGNCGTCGTACAAGMYCSAGTCSSSCASPTTYCAATMACYNLQTDLGNCGTCGNVCPVETRSDRTCIAGTCGITCLDGYGNCDGLVTNGCETDLETTTADCGACGTACSLANATPQCTGGSCAVLSCTTGYGNCDGITSNGCETNLTNTPANCSACGDICSLANATAGCAASACTVASCNTGYGNCDGVAANGCETALNTNTHCGACGTRCAAGTFCNGTACVSSCATGTTYCAASGSCDNLQTNPDDCGSCGNVCPTEPHSGPTCVTGTCSFACNTGYGNCDGIASNGCETDIYTDLADCGACGTVCTLANATPVCAEGACQIATCTRYYGNCDGITLNGCEASLLTSNANCGTCGHACTATQTCRLGVCH